ncbi:hypothetical protein Tco_0939616 [Tanacetum coccineum]|uniref:Uncharacterized protein n=1 Tax=Tanacetum coccineum TaxID=301880 RepID=A0ABQ5DNA4_9ASTR
MPSSCRCPCAHNLAFIPYNYASGTACSSKSFVPIACCQQELDSLSMAGAKVVHTTAGGSNQAGYTTSRNQLSAEDCPGRYTFSRRNQLPAGALVADQCQQDLNSPEKEKRNPWVSNFRFSFDMYFDVVVENK